MDTPSDGAELLKSFQELSAHETFETLASAYLVKAIALTGAEDGIIVDAAGSPIAPPHTDALPARLLGGTLPENWPTGRPYRCASIRGLVVPLALDQAGRARMTLAPARATDAALEALELMSHYTMARAQLLIALKAAESAQLQAQGAHEAQMEMALRLYDLYEEAQNQAIRDGLTGLATHDFFQQRLAQEMRESIRYGWPLSMMIFDLDHFKSINDTYGHQAGDLVLKGAADLLMNRVRASDLVARYGGEEFAIVLPHTNDEDAYNLAERLRADLEAMPFAISPERKLKVTASIGLASRGENDHLPKDLIKRADVALYSAKNGGRNRVVRAQGPTVEAINAIGAPRQGSQEMFFTIARALSAAIEARIPALHGHSEAVGKLAKDMARVIGLPLEKQDAMQIAGLLHDVGMLSVPESVIFKEDRLDDDDWEKMRDHAAAGVGILARFSTFSGLLEAVLYHHERWDGQGYPEKLKGDAIPMGARILAICDSYEAMIRGDYLHGQGRTPEEAIAEIRRCAGAQFDPQLVEVFLKTLQQQKTLQGA